MSKKVVVILFETVIKVEKPRHELTIEEIENDLDGLNYLAGKTLILSITKHSKEHCLLIQMGAFRI